MKLISIFATISLLAVVTQAYPGRVQAGTIRAINPNRKDASEECLDIKEICTGNDGVGLRARNADHDENDDHDHGNLRRREDYPGDGGDDGDDGDDGGDILI